jgi:acetyl esterase/lipase
MLRTLIKTSSIALLAGTMVAFRAAGAGEPLVLDLWPGKPPGDLPVRGAEKSFISVSPKYGTNRLITNVTKPAITVLPPPPGTNTGTAMIVCPGGGYWNLFWDKEGTQIAAWLNANGMAAIILKYRVPRPPNVPEPETPIGPLMDAQRAVSTVRSRAAEWGIDPHRIGIVGFSAGGHLALATAAGFERRAYDPIDAIDAVSSRPDFAVLCYSGYLKDYHKDEIWPGLHLPSTTPPIFLVHATDDTTSPAENSAIMYLALKRAGIPVELHIYATGEHDFGVLQNGNLPTSWPDLCLNWLRSFGLLKPRP